ncbi:hypothetical protein [Velocimicrobium porci]|nr:hypothetical protein [Velocimicrobium porci]
MMNEWIELSEQEEIEQRNQSKLRKRQALAYIEEEVNFKEEKEYEFI